MVKKQNSVIWIKTALLDVSETEKAKATKMCVIKRNFIFENYLKMFRSHSTWKWSGISKRKENWYGYL